MRKLFIYLKGYIKECVLAPLFKMLEALLELFVPLVVQRIIDIGIAEKNEAYIFKMCAVLAVLALIGLIFSITAQFFAAKAAVGFSAELRHSLFRHIGTLSYSDIDKFGASQLITRMTSDVNQLQNGVNLTLRLLLRSPFVVFGAVIMAFSVDGVSALSFAGAVPVIGAAVFAVMLAGIPLYKAAQKKLDSLLSLVRQALSGTRVIRAFCREGDFDAKFRAQNGELTLAGRRAGRVSSLMNPLSYVLINIAIVVLIYTGALRVNSGTLSRGAVVALYNYMAQILVELIKLANLIISITKAAASGARIQSVFESSPALSYPETGAVLNENAAAAEFKDVSFSYASAGAPALRNISFKAKKGDKIGIIGATGAGKTTLINLIPRFYDADSGEVLLFGNPVKSYTAEQLNAMVAVVPQSAQLFSGTIRENLLWGNENAGEDELLRALETAQGTDIISAKKNGLDEYLSEGGVNLSGGQRQRLTIARALVKKAPILILDDSASALDLATDLRLRRALAAMENPPLLFIVSQRCSAVMGCDKILVIDDGAAVQCGSHAELMESGGIYREIYDSQSGVKKNA